LSTVTEKVTDLQEQPGSTKSRGQEDFTAVPLDTAPSLPSFSPISADPFKEHATFDMLSDGLPAKGIYKENASEVYKETMGNARNPFLAEGNEKDSLEMKYTEPPFAKAEAAILSQAKEETQLEGPKELPNLEKMLAQQLKMSPETPQDLLEKNEEDPFSNKDKYRAGDQGEKGALKEDLLRREEYADFKPFEPIWEVKGASHGLSSVREDVGSKIDAKLESGSDERYGVDKLDVQKDYEKESEGSTEDRSFPSTPEAVKEPSQTYITCTKFESSISPDGNKVKSLSPLEEGTSENRTDDEKKIAEMKAQTSAEQGDFGTRAIGKQEGQEADYAKTESVSTVPSDTAASMPEGLTPDLVQEAYESEMHDATCTKLAYETKIDLVQTSESVQETLKPVTQLCPSFEESEAAPSPILPDIVMEAPLSTGTAGAEASAVQLEASPLETFIPPTNYENVKETEKPPAYQEAVNVPLVQAQEAKEALAFKKPDHESSASPEDIETPYISIACDLIKETKVSESAPPSFTDYSKTPITECISQVVPEHKELDEKLSPRFGKSDLFNSQVIPDFTEKVSEDPSLILKSKSTESIVTDDEHEEQLVDSVVATGKPYLESFQPEPDSSKIVAALPSEPTPAKIAKAEKIPLQMEELNAVAYSADTSVATEPKPGDNRELSPVESSPVPGEEDFVMLAHPKTAPEFVAEATGREVMHEDESEEIGEVIRGEKRQLPCPELPCDLSIKNVEVKAEEDTNALKKSWEAVDREVPEVSMVSLPATDTSSLSAEKEIVSVEKPEAFEKEAEREAASVKEKEKPTAVFSAKLNKSS
ncbi:RTN4 protein, partial [Psophia crepitans]|nr:RTN4 protein [Psophia crepitans]